MKHSMLCAAFTRRLEAYHDGELPVDEQIAVGSHLADCAACNATVRELRELRGAMLDQLAGMTPAVDRALDQLSRSVVSQAKAERSQSLTVRITRMFEDLHLVWAGLAGSAATASCVAIMGAVLHFAPPERADSLAVLLSQPGTNRNPVRMDNLTAAPRVDEQNVMRAMLVDSPEGASQSMTVAGIVTLEGRLSRAALLDSGGYPSMDARRVMDAVSAARFQPAHRRGTPVAVNLVWLLERTTVRGKISS